MNSLILDQIKKKYELHPEAVTATISATGFSCNVLFGRGFVEGGNDNADYSRLTVQNHFTCYIEYEANFERDVIVTVDGVDFVVVSKDILDTMGACEVWLA